VAQFRRKLKEQKAGVELRSETRVIYTKIGHVLLRTMSYHVRKLSLPQYKAFIKFKYNSKV
jgi:hypothetical protein